MNLRKIDLNLLIVFDALMKTGNATRAGEALGLSQPAISHALARLRAAVGDELFERGPAGLRPTVRAHAIAAPLRQALFQIQTALEPDGFTPATACQRFAIAVHNYVTTILLPPLAAIVRREAPGIDLRIVPGDMIDVVGQLDRGHIDLAIGNFGELPSRLEGETLLRERYVCIARKGHPLFAEAVTAERFAAVPHLLVALTGAECDWIDEALAPLGLQRRIAMTVPHFLAAATVLVETDLIASVSQRVAQKFAHRNGLEMAELPIDAPPISCSQIWHRHRTQQPAHAWLRARIRNVADGLADGSCAD